MTAESTDPSLDDLLDKLHQGDVSAAAQLFLQYEPYLRLVVRRKLSSALRAKFDSADVVQSVWADVLQGFREAGWRFPDVQHLRSFLVKATHNRFIDRLRQNLTELKKETRLVDETSTNLPASPLPRPSELVQADELWNQLLELCPPGHVEILRLKREGLALADIAARTGFHESSVRRILYDLHRKLRELRAD